MMDVYEATQALLSEIVPDANVTYYLLQYNADKDQFELPAFPAVTYLYGNLTPIVTHEGASNLHRVSLDVEVWGDLETVSKNGTEIINELSGKRITVENVVFTVIATEVRDIYDMGLDFHHRFIRFGGLIDIGDTQDESR